MSAGFWSAGRGKGTQTPSPCPEPPSPLERNSLSYFGTLITVGTYKGGRSSWADRFDWPSVKSAQRRATTPRVIAVNPLMVKV